VKRIAGSFQRAMPNTGWGMTATNAIGTGISGENYLARPGSSGVVSAVLDLAIVDESGTHLPARTSGEIMIRGTSVIHGYWNRPAENAQSFQDGWFRTGDVGYVDDEGYLFIVDRIKDLVIRGGENVGCAEVEAALLEHPNVVEAAVYSVPDDRLGEEIGATVYCRGTIDEEELRGFLRERLARFKIPRYIQFVQDPLPRIATGKIDKRLIREQAGVAPL
jgi:long-chain acyl-CoA synthetase